MAGNITRTISLNRDNIVRFIGDPAFFEQIPGIQILEQQLKGCRESFLASGRERGCSCRADAGLLTECMTALLRVLTEAKETAPQTVQSFIRYVAKTDQIDNVGVTIFFRSADGSNTLQQYNFP
jgi:hypothetical protein